MGANLCSLRRSKAPGFRAAKSSLNGSSIIDLITPGCFKTGDPESDNLFSAKKTENSRRAPVVRRASEKKVRKMTLEDRVLDSPGRIGGGDELHVFKKRSYIKMYPFSSRVHHEHTSLICQARDRISLVRAENGNGEKSGVCGMRRNQSGESKKKVSFRLPQEGDIILYSPQPTHGSASDSEDSF